MPGDGALSEAAQAHPKGSINMPVPCLPKPWGNLGQSPVCTGIFTHRFC